MQVDLHDTIVAISSAPGAAARAIIRCTGPDAFRLLIITTRDRTAVDSAFAISGLRSELPAQLLIFPAPYTYTGQDIVEIHTLGSPPLVDALVSHLLSLGMRAARPGEFTLRAFLAGKLDLTQAEAVLAVIAADSSDELKRALTQLAGGLGQPLRRLREDLLGVLAEVEAGLDFSDEDLSFISTEQLRKRLAAARRTLIEVQNQIHERGTSGRAFRVVFAGPPNAGKSSLFNALLGQSAALVSPIAGTTRDYLMGTMTIDGMKIELIDTAGADTVSDTIMAQAQSGREQQLTDADLVIECRAADLIHTPADLIHTPDANPARCISVQTKADLSPGNSGMRTSVVTGEGLEPLRETIAQRAKNERRPFSLAPSLSRCSQHVTSAVLHLENAAALTADSGPPELLAFELRLALDQIGEMVGAVYADDLLDRIFSQFCIGK